MADNDNKLVKEGNDILNELVETNDPNEIDDIIKRFNLNYTKKSIARVTTQDNILDKTYELMQERLAIEPDGLSNKDLISMADAMNKHISSTIQNTKQLDTTSLIQLQQNNTVNIGVNELDKDQRERVLEVINNIMNRSKNINREELVIDGDDGSEEYNAE
jgi:methionine synthase II (cobalamin-independent)